MSLKMFRIADRPDLDQATLVALTDRLEPDQALEFQAACLQLLETGRRKLIVNLRGVRSVPSIIVGAVMDAYVLAQGRELILDADVNATNKFIRLVPKLLTAKQQPPPAAGPEQAEDEPKQEE